MLGRHEGPGEGSLGMTERGEQSTFNDNRQGQASKWGRPVPQAGGKAQISRRAGVESDRGGQIEEIHCLGGRKVIWIGKGGGPLSREEYRGATFVFQRKKVTWEEDWHRLSTELKTRNDSKASGERRYVSTGVGKKKERENKGRKRFFSILERTGH